MKMRWIRWLGGLFGVMWLLITGVLWTSRPPDGRLQDVLLLGRSSGRGYSYALATIGDIRPRQLTPLAGGYYFVGWSRDWQWLYFIYTPTVYAPNHDYEIVRISVSGKIRESFDTYHVSPWNIGKLNRRGYYAPQLFWTPDHEWAVYPHLVSNQPVLVARNEAGTQVVYLTHGETAQPCAIDNEWVYFSGYDDLNLHLFRARLDGREIQDLTMNQLGDFYLDYFDPDQDLIIVRQVIDDQSRFVNLSRDGSGFFPLSDTTAPVTERSARSRVVASLPLHQLVLTAVRGNVLRAINAQDGKTLWNIDFDDWGDLIAISPDENTLYLRNHIRSDDSTAVEGINWDGTGRTILYTFDKEQSFLGFDPVSETLLYLQTDNAHSPIEIWRRNPDGSSQKLASFANSVDRVWNPTSGDSWIMLNVYSQPNVSTYRIHPDGTGLERILNGPSWWNYVEAFGPKWELKWQPPIHAIFGAALLMISGLRWPKKRQGGR